MLMDKVKRILLTLLGVASLAFIAKVLLQSYESLDDVATAIPLLSSALALIPAVSMLIIKAILHALFIEDVVGEETDRPRIVASYAQSQIIRYVPGKVWGIIYQSERIVDLIPRRVVWLGHFQQVLVTNLNGVGVIAAIFCFLLLDELAAVIVAVGFLALTYLCISRSLFTALFQHRWFRSWAAEVTIRRPSHVRSLLELTLLQLEWVAYFACWFLIAPTFFTASDTILLGTCYASASLIGLIVLVMPSGLFVREASFIWLAGLLGYEGDLLLLYGVVARLLFTIADVLCAVVLLGYRRFLRKPQYRAA